MEIMYPRCAGLDVHKDSVFARVRCVSEPRHDEVREFWDDDHARCLT